MKPLSTDQIRSTFIEFFKERGHTEVPSSPLVPENDPTLLFTNAGMVQFKETFTGKEKRTYQRAVSSQKCVRAGGKHNDLENVGFTPRHHTFFEMLGNFSFGDYFKREAIEFAWTFVTQVLQIPPNRLCVTVFRGDDEVPADDDAASIWKEVGVSDERIFRLGKSENYWQMGETGPQGPCSEIHYFEGADPENMLDEKRVETSDGWIEIWNLVFMQFVRKSADAPIERLPSPCIDTGAGLERLAMVLGGKKSTYDTDLFSSALTAIAEDAEKTYQKGDSQDDVAMRVIVDHARATAFLVSDGVLPSNEGRGYVLRRIMRRAIRYGKQLGFEENFFFKHCLHVVDQMSSSYRSLLDARALIEKVARSEESAFRRTLDRGLRLLDQEISAAKAAALGLLPPAFVANLYDTFGFPVDLTRVIAGEHGLSVDEEAANAEVKIRQAKGTPSGLSKERAVESIWFDLRDQCGQTRFLGYEHDTSDAKILVIIQDGERLDKADAGAVEVILDQTPFYGEAGGQAGDSGEIQGSKGKLRIDDTQRPLPDLIVHRGELTGELSVGATVQTRVDAGQRARTERNHSATHLLHLALRETLGDHVQQKGSLVSPERLRFDFSHFDPVSKKELRAIEERVNALVLENRATTVREESLEDAKNLGATMLFGEKYADSVRVVRIGGVSLELCGGTHVQATGDIGLFKIISEGALASGIRRMEAVTGLTAMRFAQAQSECVQHISSLLNAGQEELPLRVKALLKKTKTLEKDLENARAKAALGENSDTESIEIGGVPVIIQRLSETPKSALRKIADQLRDKIKSGVVLVAAKEDEKASLLIATTKDLSKRINAGDLMRAATSKMEGSGGGRPDFAQGGGLASKLELAIEEAKTKISAAAKSPS